MRFIKVMRRRQAEPKAKKPAGESFAVLILAAGEGTRMESQVPKVLHPVGGRPMLFHVLRAANALKPQAIGLVIGHNGDKVRAAVEQFVAESAFLKPVSFIRQNQQHGSGHAVLQAVPFLKRFASVLVLYGDTPLLTYETLQSLAHQHQSEKAQATMLTAKIANPKGYGRIIRNPLGEILKIVEESDAGPKELAVNEVNSGVGMFAVAPMLEALREVSPAGEKREIYLTRVIEILRGQGGRVASVAASNPEEILGVNTRLQLASVDRILGRRTLERLMLSGTTIVDPAHTYVDSTVDVGPDVTLFPGTMIRGRSTVGKGSRLGPYSWIEDCALGADVEIRMSWVAGAKVGDGAMIGPFSHVRPGTTIGTKARIGNFSEIKASRIGPNAKVPHLSYVGDADIQENVNLGAGTITCNFDGNAKHPTLIEKNAFIGSNVNLVAPIKIGAGAVIGAGSTITEDVPAESMAIARAHQVVKPKRR